MLAARLTLSTFVLGFAIAGCFAQDLIEDQIGNRSSGAEAIEFLTSDQVQQSFIAKTEHIDAIEIALKRQNPGAAIVIITLLPVTLSNVTQALASQGKTVGPDFDGNLRLEIPSSPLLVRPGEAYWIRVSEDVPTFRWCSMRTARFQPVEH